MELWSRRSVAPLCWLGSLRQACVHHITRLVSFRSETLPGLVLLGQQWHYYRIYLIIILHPVQWQLLSHTLPL